MISRFAPAPTGFLHLGHVVNAIYVWRETRARGGRILLRIEDHDRQRSRREYEDEILDDLAWLGFSADEPLVRQSERGEIYERALDGLRRQGLVYACNCSRADIGRDVRPERADPHASALDVNATTRVGPTFQGGLGAELCYPGTCRDRGLAEGPGLGVRVRLEPSIERFDDVRHGPLEQRPYEQCGDLLVKDRDGNWTYQFAATVDDYVQRVTLVIRGDDLLPSTGRQIQLARLLGRTEPPAFLHHPLIMKSPRQKLSKSDGDSGIRELRARGWTPPQVLDHAMSQVGRFPYDLRS
ncbi:MAG TPA: glutamate--tRNA ligase family protein [Vicinamibacterales bacterium]|nr:glutamate--tRNA ligase family protein [Vicinamibacterales bacterium]